MRRLVIQKSGTLSLKVRTNQGRLKIKFLNDDQVCVTITACMTFCR